MQNSDKIENDLSVTQLLKSGQLGERAASVCNREGLTFLSEIIEYYYENGHFKYLRNGGPKTQKELLTLFDKYKWYQFHPNPDRLKMHYYEELESLSKENMRKLQDQIDVWLSTMSGRSRKALMQSVGSYVATTLFEIIFDKSVGYQNIRNIGAKSNAELAEFRLNCIRFVNELKRSQEDDEDVI